MDDRRAGKEQGNDAQLVRESAAGDKAAYGKLVRMHSKRIYSIAYSVLSDFQSAQDIAQEVFVKAYQKLGKLRKPESFGSWVDAIARNHARKALARRRKNSVSTYDFSDDAGHPATEKKEHLSELKEAVDLLPDSYREPLLMRYMGGSDYGEIAEHLGIERNTAEVRVFRAKKMLKEMLTRSGRR